MFAASTRSSFSPGRDGVAEAPGLTNPDAMATSATVPLDVRK